jgi:type I restriction enzyme, S subunit
VSELPDGWKIATIADVTDYISRGKSPKYTDLSSLPVVNQKAIRWFGIQKEHLKYVHPDQFDSWAPERYIQEGDILWNSTGTGTIGRACLVSQENLEPPKVVDSHVTIVRPNKASIESSYLFAWIRSSEVQDTIASLYSGSTNQVELNRATIAATQIPLAPLNEQKRIADKLDALLARVDACRERLDRVPLILKRFRQAVLAAATSGELTEDWRKENQCNFDEWQEVDVQSIAMVGTGSTPLRSNSRFFSSSGTPWITSAATGELFVTKAHEFVTEEAVLAHRLKRYPIGTLLVAMYGEGKTRGQVAELAIEATINQACAAVIVDEAQAVKEFVKLTLQANYLEMRELAEGGNQPNLNLSKIKEFKLALPSIDEQQEIIHRVKALFTLIDRLEARYKTARTQVEQLTPALLAKAFRGELVPQDPNDEPASVLLEHIRAGRVVAEEDGAKPRRRKTDKSSKAEVIVSNRKDVHPSHLSNVLTTRDPLTAEALFSASQLELNIDDSAV